MDLLANKMIDALGGTNAAAKMMGKSAPVVSQWRKNSIPPDCLELIRYRKPKIFKEVMAEMGVVK
jgi:DNA-binding transcriptional regulator YdaS (Cro superfamily)